MKIVSHRGLWPKKSQQNTKDALMHSLAKGYGIETDVRDYAGELTIAHDPPTKVKYSFKELLKDYMINGSDLPLALNIKADGLADKISSELTNTNASNVFVFDMSTPDMVVYARYLVPFFTRQSDIEQLPVLYTQATGVWLDTIEHEWITADAINSHIIRGKSVCIVSPELHGREFECFWHKLKNWDLASRESCMLCTDFPEQASSYFNG